MTNWNFEFITNLQYKVKMLTAQVESFKSGDIYITMHSEFQQALSASNRRIKKLEKELAESRSQNITMREKWMQVFDDIKKEQEKELNKKEREKKVIEERALRAERKLDETRKKLKEKSKEVYAALTELEEEKGKTLKLKAQINRDYKNSSIPSSMKPNRKKITNNREKSGKSPGGQPGHKGHKRKKLTPTNRIPIPVPEEYLNIRNYKPTGNIVEKQMINIRFEIIVDEYYTPEFRMQKTGQRVHADFPEGIVNEVNLGGSIRAFAFLLNNRYCVSIKNVREVLSEMTDNELQISTGFINGLSKEFSQKTEAERKDLFADMLLSPVMNTDLACGRLNGKNVNFAVCATPGIALYFYKEHKGHKAIKGTPVEDYQHTLVHDHDKTYYNYGGKHQECLGHPIRYLKDSIDNEPKLEWNKQMRGLLQEMIHHRKNLEPNEDVDPDKIDAYTARYRGITKLAKREYEYEPPTKYYIEGFNLYKKLDDYEENHLLFLYDKNIPTTNNLSERLLRVLKRKQRQVMSFRSSENMEFLCDSMSIIETFRLQDRNMYKSAVEIFNQ